MKKFFAKKAILVAVTMLVSGVFTSLTASAEHLDNQDNLDQLSHWGCRDQSVSLLCKADGHLQQITAYTDCGQTYEGGFCSNVYVPGYNQRRMRVEWRCENGNMVWALGNRGWCEVVSRF